MKDSITPVDSRDAGKAPAPILSTPLEGSITASCGCKLKDGETTVTVRYSGEDCCWDGFHPCVTYAEYCPACAEKAHAWPEFLPTEGAADAWLASSVKPFHPAENIASDGALPRHSPETPDEPKPPTSNLSGEAG